MERRQLAVVSGYQGIIAACKARKEELGISDAEFEEASGLTRGHWSKITGYIKVLGPLTMGKVLRGLGLDLIVSENVELTAKVREACASRNENQVRKRPVLAKASGADFPYLFTSKNGSEMALKRAAALTPSRRRAIARKAARAGIKKRRLARLASTP
jgi:hypothetical protein